MALIQVVDLKLAQAAVLGLTTGLALLVLNLEALMETRVQEAGLTPALVLETVTEQVVLVPVLEPMVVTLVQLMVLTAIMQIVAGLEQQVV